MSVLEHWCRRCEHRLALHDSRNAGYTGCRCCRDTEGSAEPSPRLPETYSTPGGQAEPLYGPGTTRNAGTMHAVRACDCPACHAAYGALQPDRRTQSA